MTSVPSTSHWGGMQRQSLVCCRRIEAVAVSQDQFQAWLNKTRQAPDHLDFARFEALRQPSSYCPVQYFSQVEPGLFERILHREGPTMTQKQDGGEGAY